MTYATNPTTYIHKKKLKIASECYGWQNQNVVVTRPKVSLPTTLQSL